MATDAGTVTAVATLSGVANLTDLATVIATATPAGDELLGFIYDSGTVTATVLIVGFVVKPETITNDSAGIIWPITTFVGPVTNPYVRNATANRILSFSGLDLVADSVLVIDHYAQTVTIDGEVADVNGYPQVAQWWGLYPGDNAVECGGELLTDGSVTMEIPAAVWRSI